LGHLGKPFALRMASQDGPTNDVAVQKFFGYFFSKK
jgi:hypothetical protein